MTLRQLRTAPNPDGPDALLPGVRLTATVRSCRRVIRRMGTIREVGRVHSFVSGSNAGGSSPTGPEYQRSRQVERSAAKGPVVATYPPYTAQAAEQAGECYDSYKRMVTSGGRQPTPDEQRHLDQLRWLCAYTEGADLWRKGILKVFNRGALTRWDETQERSFRRTYADLVGAEEADRSEAR